MAGTTLSVGLALGLLLGGANRLLVILALIPAAAMGFTLLDRSQTGPDAGETGLIARTTLHVSAR